jgi:MFS transporter, FSR family, fosmidomycin resistance protein
MATAIATQDRDLPVISLIGAAHFGSHFFQLVLPPLFPLLKVAFGVGYTELGLLMTLFFAASGLAQTPAGFLVDRIGAAPVLIGGLSLLAGGALLAGLAPSYTLLLPVAVLMGLGNSVFHPSDYAILSRRISPSRMARAFSVHTVGGTLGWAAAPVVVLALASASSWRVALVATGLAGLAIAGLLIANREQIEIEPVRHPAGHEARGTKGVLFTLPVVVCFLYFCFQAVSLSATQSFLPISLNHLHGTPLEVATTTVTAFMLGSAVGTLAGGVVADRSGRLQTIIIGGVLAGALVMLLLAFVALPPAALLAAVAVAGALTGSTTPSRDLLVRRAAPEGATGRVFGFVYSGLDLGGTVTPAIAGALIDHDRPRAVLLLIAAVMAITIFTVANVRTRPQPTAVPA